MATEIKCLCQVFYVVLGVRALHLSLQANFSATNYNLFAGWIYADLVERFTLIVSLYVF